VEIRAPARRVFRLAWNVGEDGVGLVNGASFEEGRPVEIAFTLPGGDRLTLRAEIAGLEAQDDDLRFMDPPSDARAAIRQYVHQRLGLPI
jgi:hypothetical protein